jgi:hypothetical protein
MGRRTKMPIQEHPPLDSSHELMSPKKRAWWAEVWDKRPLKQPRLAVLQFAMNSTPRPSAPNETIAFGYMNLNKFHDRESLAIVEAIEAIDPTFFDTYPREASTTFDVDFKKAQVGEAAKAFYRHGLAAYGKPGLRSSTSVIGSLAAL